MRCCAAEIVVLCEDLGPSLDLDNGSSCQMTLVRTAAHRALRLQHWLLLRRLVAERREAHRGLAATRAAERRCVMQTGLNRRLTAAEGGLR